MSQYLYQRKGGPILSWRRGVPMQSQAADARSLGSLGDASVLVPGAPEVLTGEGDPNAMPPGWDPPPPAGPSLAKIAMLGVAAVVGYQVLIKPQRRRRR